MTHSAHYTASTLIAEIAELKAQVERLERELADVGKQCTREECERQYWAAKHSQLEADAARRREALEKELRHHESQVLDWSEIDDPDPSSQDVLEYHRERVAFLQAALAEPAQAEQKETDERSLADRRCAACQLRPQAPAQPSRGGCDACGGDKVVHLDGGKCRQDDCALPHKPCPKCGKE